MGKTEELNAIINRASKRNHTVVSESWGICYDCLEAEQIGLSGWAEKMGAALGLSPSTVYERVNAAKMRIKLVVNFGNAPKVSYIAEKGYSYFVTAWRYYKQGVSLEEIYDAIEAFSPIETFRAEMSRAYGGGHEVDARVNHLFRKLEMFYEESESLGLSEWARKALQLAYKALQRDIEKSEDLRMSVK